MDKGLKTALIIGGIVIGVIVILSFVPGLFGGWQGYGWGGMMGPGMMGGYGTMFLIPIVVIGLIVWAVVTATRRTVDSDYASRSGESALEILKRRYARGEITKQEFEERKSDLV